MILALIIPLYCIYYTWAWLFVIYFFVLNYTTSPGAPNTEKKVLLVLTSIMFLSTCLIGVTILKRNSFIFWATFILWLVIANGIQEGRRIFENTQKYILMGTSSNFGNMFSAAAASLFLTFLPMLPMQIIFMNLLYDMSNMTLPTDNIDQEFVKTPKKWNINFVRKYTLFFGPFSSLYDFLTFGIMLFIFIAPMHLNLANPQQVKVAASIFQSGWFVESFWTEVLIIFVIRTRKVPFISSKPGKWVALLTLSLIAFGTVLPFTPFGSFLGFVPLPMAYWGLLILMVATYLLLVDAGKVFFYKICKNM